MRCIAKQCRDEDDRSEWRAKNIYVYNGLSLCLRHLLVAEYLEEDGLPSNNKLITRINETTEWVADTVVMTRG